MRKHHVDYENAMNLKALGFDEPCSTRFAKPPIGSSTYVFRNDSVTVNRQHPESTCTAPSWTHAFEWMEKDYGLYYSRQMSSVDPIEYLICIGNVAYKKLTFDKNVEPKTIFKQILESMLFIANKIASGGFKPRPEKSGMKVIEIYEFQLKTIIDSLRLTSNIYDSGDGDTAYDRGFRQAKAYANNALEGKKDKPVKYV